MKLIKQFHEILFITPEPLKAIELVGRTCYKSEDKITSDSAEKFVKMLIKRGHEAMIEHAYMQVKLVTNRGVTHEQVRHRPASYGQESTRFVTYGGTDMKFILPVWLDNSTNIVGESEWDIFCGILSRCEYAYNSLLALGWKPQQAREVLPNALKTEIVVTANMREWRHIFKLRCAPDAHPQMRGLMLELLREAKARVPIIFDDIDF